MNPLKDILESCVDFSCVHECSDIKLFISATNVETGRVKIFDSHHLTADMVMASACLPHMFQAVVIDGVPYWDGGYMGNPSLFPFHHQADAADILVVQINPIERKGIPTTPMEIQNRMNEINFNSSLIQELRAIDFVARLLEEGRIDTQQYRQEYIHIIENQEALRPLGASSKLNAEWAFLTHLRDIGRESAALWLERHFDDSQVRWKDVEQLQMLATQSTDAEHFLADLTLDPPVASGNQAGDPLKDEDFLILSTVHSAKGQEWNSVFLLNVVDGSFPSEFATGDDRLIEEERRLLYVAATRAKDHLHLLVPLKFYVPQQQRYGAKHVYGAQSRFMTAPVLATCERRFYGESQSRNQIGEAVAQLDLPSKISELW